MRNNDGEEKNKVNESNKGIFYAILPFFFFTLWYLMEIIEYDNWGGGKF